MWLYEQLKNETYKHGGYTEFYVTEPKVRRIQKSRYIDRIVHRWIVDQFLKEYFETTFIQTTYACIKNRGMHKACLDVQNAMKHCKRIWGNYYILKIIKQIVYSTEGKKGQPIRKLHISNICQYIFKRSRPIHKTPTEM